MFLTSDWTASAAPLLERTIDRVKDGKIKAALKSKQEKLKSFKSLETFQKSINKTLDSFVKAAKGTKSSDFKKRAAEAERCQNLFNTEMKSLSLTRKRKEKATR